jgi:YD repeat-containing protein
MAAVCTRERVGYAFSGRVKASVIRGLAGRCAAACVLLVSPLSHADDITYGYDALGRLVSVAVAGNTANYDYDAAGNITAIRRQGSVSAAHGNASTTQVDAASHVASDQSAAR